ncbi:MAG: uracil-DNA glycosylase [Arenicellales bacterium]|nr:uracil-DNA glycosylase [Arenicellales bacterium]
MLASKQTSQFDPTCRKCRRLTQYLDEVNQDYPDYHCGPVAPFGDPAASLLVVGLAPGKHGANATGRPFTGDYAGILLYQTLHQFGFASKPESLNSKDGLVLKNCRITNAVKCLPPENKPTTQEVNECGAYLKAELVTCRKGTVVLALGAVAHKAVLKAFDLTQSKFPFKHGLKHRINEHITLVDSYHCSRYNTQTRRLTSSMFERVFKDIKELLS